MLSSGGRSCQEQTRSSFNSAGGGRRRRCASSVCLSLLLLLRADVATCERQSIPTFSHEIPSRRVSPCTPAHHFLGDGASADGTGQRPAD